MERRRRRIHAELEHLGEHEWAGDYYYGNGTGCNVSVAISPEAGVTYTWHGCLGLYDLNHGNVVDVDENKIRLRLAIDPSTSTFDAIDSELWRVRWGQRHYLIPERRMLGFCNNVNSGLVSSKDTSGLFLLRTRDTRLAVTGLPDVPPDYRKYLLQRPVATEITRILEKKTAPNRWDFYRAEVNVGANEGLVEGMELHPLRLLDNFWSVTVVEVHPATAIVEIGDYDRIPEKAPAPGTRLTSRYSDWESEGVMAPIDTDTTPAPSERR